MTAVDTLPPIHAPFVGGDVEHVLDEVFQIIEHGILNDPRSLQKEVGPSELATPCTHCLTAKLAGWEQTESGVPWLSTIGRFVHEGLERFFIAHENDRNAVHTTGLQWLTETRVTPGYIAGQPVPGSCDLFHVPSGTVIDFKIVGVSTLRSAKRGPSDTYRGQAHAYGQGWINAGHEVRHVAILYLPRNAMSLRDGIRWSEPFEPARVEEVFARANHLHTQLQALQSISVEARDAWITSLPRDPDCWDCARFHQDRPRSEALDGLIAP